MAMGDVNNQNKKYSTNYYSRFYLKASDGSMRLSPEYSGGLLKLRVTDGNFVNGKYEPLADATLSPNKARILAEEISKFREKFVAGTAEDGVAYGVDTGTSSVRPIIAVTMIDGNPYLVIGKVNPDGQYEARLDYPLNTQYHYGLEWSDISNMKVSKDFKDILEIDQLITLLNQFVAESFGAGAAATCEMMKWDYPSRKIDAIANKLGVEYKSGNYTSAGNSFFNKTDDQTGNTGNQPERLNSIDDLDI